MRIDIRGVSTVGNTDQKVKNRRILRFNIWTCIDIVYNVANYYLKQIEKW